MNEFDDNEIARLLRLKRYEQPPPGYFENFLHEFHRRQRDEMVRQPLWRICLERAHGLMLRLDARSLASYPAAFALIFCLSAGSLFAEEQRAKPARERVKETFERTLAQAESATAISHQVKDIFERAAKAVVKIHGVDEHSEICGTGFFIDPTGTLYTAYTVGGEAGNFTIEFGGKKYPARQLMADVRSGTAMLKVDETTPALPVGKSEELGVATPVVAVGFPLDLPETPSFGMLAGFDRKYLGRYFSTTHLRVNLPTQRA